MVGQAGRPKTITGFQTHTTPVLLGHGERAELATEECTYAWREGGGVCEGGGQGQRPSSSWGSFNSYVPGRIPKYADLPLSKVMEGLVILRKNPDYVPEPVPEPRK